MKGNQYSSQKPLLYIIQPKNYPLAVNMQNMYRNVLDEKKHIGRDEKADGETDDTTEIQLAEEDKPIPQDEAFHEEMVLPDEKIAAAKEAGQEQAAESERNLVIESAEREPAEENAQPEPAETELEEMDGTGKIGREMEEEIIHPAARKRFKEMTIPEKIGFLIHKPGFLPEIPVMIQTNGTAYRAIVLELVQDQLSIMPFTSMETVWLGVDEIMDIKLLVY
ncbi:CotO family spore coat protein [Heyndrickxia acidiproducens]|uniref:CotO family spore coat protein n=1 Tax=Heyndrickxia acidiproducens TaxID=1121084 RepID=UPI0003753D6C|nr:CotO family spore coat protein [Heyndrickxia acidiproducens]